jgi:hypothetical protein
MSLRELLISYATSRSFSTNGLSIEKSSLEKRQVPHYLHWNNYT